MFWRSGALSWDAGQQVDHGVPDGGGVFECCKVDAPGAERSAIEGHSAQLIEEQARAKRSAMESLVFTLKEGFEFGEMMRRTHENVLAEMLEKVLTHNTCQGAEKAFRATRDGTGSGLKRSITPLGDR